ncbi:Microtubule-associated protein 10 [Hondaea fermentalgiana]|uniref:Microtubule-associated protein 10 n=1 Tax=Hondaea fermentalgiana TaxID=2315210 RepID=A0A2R5GR98_9STRA|nr:Microtubule-associated protein 10 [Hondaea fermentalgiana]|eukprot:GBG30871.1 Microtubule-associated protein 10 [Hondaea fermentalgiana]
MILRLNLSQIVMEGSNEAGDEARALAEIDASLKLGRMTDMLAKEPRAEKLLAALDEDDYEAEPLDEAAMGGRKGASTAGDDTSDVFALQVFVESLEMTPMPANHNDVDGQNETAHANRMAVAFRLLDFPTVLIERAGSSPENFQSGKSCLFELPFEEAIAGLQSAPMYLMLLRLPEAGDKNAQVSKGVSTAASPDLHHGVLVGSTALDLSGLVGLHNVGSEGCVLPSMASTWGWKLGTFPLYDLMGNEVARVAARVRVCSFGDGLLPHLGLASAPADQQPSPVNEMETAMDVRMGQTGLPAPVPTALLETMSAVEKRLCKIERLQRRAMHLPPPEHDLASSRYQSFDGGNASLASAVF